MYYYQILNTNKTAHLHSLKCQLVHSTQPVILLLPIAPTLYAFHVIFMGNTLPIICFCTLAIEWPLLALWSRRWVRCLIFLEIAPIFLLSWSSTMYGFASRAISSEFALFKVGWLRFDTRKFFGMQFLNHILRCFRSNFYHKCCSFFDSNPNSPFPSPPSCRAARTPPPPSSCWNTPYRS